MKKKLLYLIFFLHIIFSATNGQINPDFIRFDLPSFVPAEKRFVASIVFKVDEITDQNIEIKFNKPFDVEIISAVISRNDDIEYVQVDFKNLDNELISIEVDAEKFELSPKMPHQILLNCRSLRTTRLEKKSFSAISETDENDLNDEFDSLDETKINEINFYRVQTSSGKSLLFEPNAKLEFRFKSQIPEKLYTEFWLKTEDLLENSFSIGNVNTNESLLSISQNDFGFVTFPIYENEIIRNDVFLSNGSWNYFGIMLQNTPQGIRTDVHINSELVFSTFFEAILDLEQIKVGFSNRTKDNNFEIDRLKIWDFENNLSISHKNKHFFTYEADSSILLYQSNFESLSEFTGQNGSEDIEIFSEYLNYDKSDAPIFSKAPKLTVNLGSSYNSIVWYVQEYSVAKEFILERSVGESDYEVVYKTYAESDPLKIYNYTDEIIAGSEIAFYRVKQINEDGSEVFSPEVKIGHKEIHEFNLGQNYPNPFNPNTSIYVEVIIPSEFEVNVYDLVGNNVSKLHKGVLSEGTHKFEFDGSALPSGIYFYEVISPNSQVVKKMILAK